MPVGKHLTPKQKKFIIDSRNQGMSGKDIGLVMGIARKTVYNVIWRERKKGEDIKRFKASGYKHKKQTKYHTLNVSKQNRDFIKALATEYNCTVDHAINKLIANHEEVEQYKIDAQISKTKLMHTEVLLGECWEDRKKNAIEVLHIPGTTTKETFWSKVKKAFTI